MSTDMEVVCQATDRLWQSIVLLNGIRESEIPDPVSAPFVIRQLVEAMEQYGAIGDELIESVQELLWDVADVEPDVCGICGRSWHEALFRYAVFLMAAFRVQEGRETGIMEASRWIRFIACGRICHVPADLTINLPALVRFWPIIVQEIRSFGEFESPRVEQQLRNERRKLLKGESGQSERECINEVLVVGPDGRSVWWPERTAGFEFTTTQAACFMVLYEAWCAKTPAVGEIEILDRAGSSGSRLRDVFDKGNHPAWGDLIITATKGSFKLSVPVPGKSGER